MHLTSIRTVKQVFGQLTRMSWVLLHQSKKYSHQLESIDQRWQRLSKYACEYEKTTFSDDGCQPLHEVELGLREFQIVLKNIIVHIANKRRHKLIDILSK